MRVALYCTCGATACGTIKPDAKARAFIERIWKQTHSGEGHAPCDARTAAAARRKEESRLAYNAVLDTDDD